jgi:peptidoglycan/xylan/chitin deacetylase (PgdA/CDA1 family)
MIALSPHSLEIPRGTPHPLSLRQRALAVGARACSDLLGPCGHAGFGVLMYHRITDPIAGFDPPTWNVRPKRFRQQLTGLLARGFHPWPLRKVLDWHAAGKVIPRQAFVVTFDDVYQNVYVNAFPILRELNIPATLFLATAYLDSPDPFPSDDWSAAGLPEVPAAAWRPITTAECRVMRTSGLIELGAHTHTHADFRGKPDLLLADLYDCQRELRQRFNVEQASFAFPYGTKTDGFASAELAAAVRHAGLRCALTTEPQLVRPGSDAFDWGRFGAEDDDTAGSLAAKLSGWHSRLRRWGKELLGR